MSVRFVLSVRIRSIYSILLFSLLSEGLCRVKNCTKTGIAVLSTAAPLFKEEAYYPFYQLHSANKKEGIAV
jgi:hypothetical protein